MLPYEALHVIVNDLVLLKSLLREMNYCYQTYNYRQVINFNTSVIVNCINLLIIVETV